MKNLYVKAIIVCLCMLASINAYADHTNSVSVDEARQKALYFLSYQPTFVKGRNHAPQKLSDLNLAHQALLKNGQTAYYIFSNEAGGFVIISGDERTEDVLGYSSEGVFDADNMPENMKGWLDEYATQIAYIQEHGLSSPSIRKIESYPAIDPMLTTTWSQRSPYNDECPDFFGQGKCSTGCEATALAQVMYYHRAKSVTKTTATIPGYTCVREWMIDSEPHHITVDAIPAGSPIDWDNMLDSYNGSEAPAEELAVANLMKYCGAAMQMDYYIGQSDASVSNAAMALKAYFNYRFDTDLKWRDNFSDEEWENIIYNELSNDRPVFYHGMHSTENNTDGHVFVCDGYDGMGYYHINWGWGGIYDGYFPLSAIGPREDLLYPFWQAALINAAPRDVIPSDNDISFADWQVKCLCLQNWDTNDDGEFSKEEAAAVKDLGTVFECQQSISSFDELRYFTGLTCIDDYAFFDCKGLTSVVIPNGVTSIGRSAFLGCRSLSSIIIPNSVTNISEYAFETCFFASDAFINNSALTSANNWGASIYDEELGDGICLNGTTVVGCRPWVTSVTIPDYVTSIGDYAFYGCSSLTSVVIPNGVTFIGRFAIAYCIRLTSINIPQGVTTIDDYAFHGCSGLSSLSIPSSVTSIGAFAFEGTSWYDNQHNGLVYAGKVAYKYKGEMPNGTQITIKDGTLSIAGYAFYDCGGLTSITIPDGVTSIGNSAFYGCSSLKSITIPDGVTSISSTTFSGCSRLASITIPKGVTNIGDYAFRDCSGLKEIYCYAEETPETSNFTFYNVNVSRVMLVVPDDVADKYKAHPIWRRFRIETPTGIPSIEDGKSKMEDGSIYNLSGQRLSKPIKGINVLNGKKVAIK